MNMVGVMSKRDKLERKVRSRYYRARGGTQLQQEGLEPLPSQQVESLMQVLLDFLFEDEDCSED